MVWFISTKSSSIYNQILTNGIADRKQFEQEKQLIASNQKAESEAKTASVLRQQLADLGKNRPISLVTLYFSIFL